MVENECKLDTDVDEYVDKFKWELMQVVHAWASVRKQYRHRRANKLAINFNYASAKKHFDEK